jgi:hypothetical protein
MGKKGRVFFKRVWSLIILVLHSLRCASPVVCPVRIDLSCSRSYRPTNGSKGRCSTIQQVLPLSGLLLVRNIARSCKVIRAQEPNSSNFRQRQPNFLTLKGACTQSLAPVLELQIKYTS